MVTAEKIMDMLDWHMPSEIQAKGRALAMNMDTFIPFIQPLTPKHNKNVWDNCAAIIAEKKDEELKPYLTELLEWLQDMNWPGAFCILHRLQKYTDTNSISNAVNACVKKPKWKEMRFGNATCVYFGINSKFVLKNKELIPVSLSVSG